MRAASTIFMLWIRTSQLLVGSSYSDMLYVHARVVWTQPRRAVERLYVQPEAKVRCPDLMIMITRPRSRARRAVNVQGCRVPRRLSNAAGATARQRSDLLAPACMWPAAIHAAAANI